MNKDEYWKTVNGWADEYGLPRSKSNLSYQYNPSKVKVSCRKCSKTKLRMQRHHKTNDFFFANALPSVYARRYCQFLDADTDKLCQRCHLTWHRYIAPKLRPMWEEFKDYPKLSFREKIKWCEKWRGKILVWYNKWLSQPVNHSKKRGSNEKS